MATNDPLDDSQDKPKFAADLGFLSFDQANVDRTMGLDTQATRQQDLENERKGREIERQQKDAASLAQKMQNSNAEAMMRSTGQEFYTDPFGNLQPIRDPGSGKPVFREQDRIDYQPDGTPVQRKVDREGQITFVNPDKDAPVGPAESDPGTLYKQNKYQPWERVGSAFDISKSEGYSQETADAAKKVADKGTEKLRLAAEEGIGKIKAQNTLDVATHAQREQELTGQITSLNDEVNAIEENPTYKDKEGGFLGFGSKPTSAAASLQSQADAKRSQISQLETERASAVENKMKAEAAEKKNKIEADILESTNKLQGYQATEDARRNTLLKTGKSPEEIAADPLIASIAKKKEEVGLNKSRHERQHSILQAAGESAAKAFAVDPPSPDDLQTIDQDYNAKSATFETIKGQIAAEQKRISDGNYTNRDEVRAANDRISKLSDQMDTAVANVNASLEVRNRAIEASKNFNGQAKPGQRSIQVSVGPDFQLNFKDERKVDPTQPALPITAPATQAPNAPETPEQKAVREKSQILSRLTTSAALRESSIRPTSLFAQIKKYTIGDNSEDQLASMALHTDDELARQATAGGSDLPESMRSAAIDKDTWAKMSAGEKKSYLAERMKFASEDDKRKLAESWFNKEFDVATQGMPEADRANLKQDVENINKLNLDKKLPGVVLSGGMIRVNPRMELDEKQTNSALDSMLKQGQITQEQATAAKNAYTGVRKKAEDQTKQAILQSDHFQKFAADSKIGSLSPDEQIAAYNKKFSGPWTAASEALIGAVEGAKQNYVGAWQGAKLLRAAQTGSEEQRMNATLKVFEQITKDQEADQKGQDMSETAQSARGVGNTFGQMGAQVLPALLAGLFTKGRAAGAAEGANLSIQSLTNAAQYALQGYQDTVNQGAKNAGYNSIQELVKADPKLAQEIHEAAVRSMADNIKISPNEMIPVEKMVKPIEKLGATRWGRVVDRLLVNPGTESLQEYLSQYAQSGLTNTALGDNSTPINSITADQAGQIFLGSALLSVPIASIQQRIQNRQIGRLAQEAQEANQNYTKVGGANFFLNDVNAAFAAFPTATPSANVSQADQYKADGEVAASLTSQQQPGEAPFRPEHIQEARSLAPVNTQEESQAIQTQIADLDSKVNAAQAAYEQASQSRGALSGVNFEAQAEAAQNLSTAINQRAGFIHSTASRMGDMQQRSIDTIKAAREILSNSDPQARSIASGILKISNGQGINLLTGSERDLLIRPREITSVDPATGAPVKQTIPPFIRMERGTPIVTDEAISWLSDNEMPITEGLVPLDETGQLRQIEEKEKSNAQQQAGTPNGGVATPGLAGANSQPGEQSEVRGEGDRGSAVAGSGQGDAGVAPTGITSPLFSPFSQRVADRRRANAQRRAPAVPAVVAGEAKSLIGGLAQIESGTGLKPIQVSASIAGPSGVSVIPTDEGGIFLQYNLATLSKAAAQSSGNQNTTEGSASEWLHSALGEEGLHYGWFAHLRDQWNELPQEKRGGFKQYVFVETQKRFSDMRENLAKIRDTQTGAELGQAILAAYNNYYGTGNSSVNVTPENASGKALEVLDGLFSKDSSKTENSYAFMNELARSIAQMRTEGRVTENADATGFIEAVLKYIKDAMEALRKIAANTKKYDPALDEMVSSMENRYAEVNALLNGVESTGETPKSTENRQNGPVSAQEVPVLARLQRENAKLQSQVGEQKAAQERAAKRRGDAQLAAKAVNPKNMDGVQLGKPNVVVGANNEKIPGRYVSMPPGVVQTSHIPEEGFRKNPNYGGENTRPYDTDQTEQQKVRNIALPGAMITESIVNNGPSAADGPPQIARVTFTTPEGETKTVIQTAGGNGREMGVNLADSKDQDRLSQANQENAALFGLDGMPEGNRVYRFLGDFDLRDPEQAKQYQQLVDKLNPAPGKVQGTSQRAKIDASLNVSPEVIGNLQMGIQPSDAQAALREIINSPNSGVDRNLMEATAADPIQSQQYIQQLIIQRGLNSDALNNIYFDTRPDTKDQPARSTMRSLIAGAAELGVKLRNAEKPEIADALAAAIENINSQLSSGKALKGAIAQVASQQESDILAQGGSKKGSGQANTSSSDVQAIARALLANVVTDKNGNRVNASATQENFSILMDQISGAVATHSDEAELFGPSPSVSDLIKAAIDANTRLRQKESTDAKIDVAARAPRGDIGGDEGTQTADSRRGNGIVSNAGGNRGNRAASQGVGREGNGNPSQGEQGESGSDRLNEAKAERISPPRVVNERGIDERLVNAFKYSKYVYFDVLGIPVYKFDKSKIPAGLTQETLSKKEAVIKEGSLLNTVIGVPPGTISREKMRELIFTYFMKGGHDKKRLGDVKKPKSLRHPELLFLGGGGGSGKSSILDIVKKDYSFNTEGHVVVNPDEVREFIPEYQELNEYHHNASSAITHEEASLIAKRIEAEAMWNRYPIVLDGTLANKEKALARFAYARSKAYKPVLLGITIDPHEAMVRAAKRGQTSGRFVPTKVLLDAHKGFNSAVSEYVQDFLKHGDDVRIYDNTPPKATELPLDEVVKGINPYITPRTKLNTNPKTLEELVASYGQALIRGGELVVNARRSRFQDELTGDLFSQPKAPLTEQNSGPTLSQEPNNERSNQQSEKSSNRAGDLREPSQGGEQVGSDASLSEGAGLSGRVSTAGIQRQRDGRADQARVGSELNRQVPENPDERNFSIRDIDSIAPVTNGEKWDANIEAINLLRVLQKEKRNATPEEKSVLAKYTGWGWAKEAFNQDNDRWAKRYAALRKILGEDEFMAARKSSLNAHYTSPEIIRSMWNIAERLGFKGGRVLEPAGGVGHFFGMMPEEILNHSKLYGVELDKISGEIFKLLYPEAEIQVAGFQEAGIPNNSMDLAISNVPFGNYKVAGGKDYPNLLIHDYFFARSLDKVKPGGLVMFITSDGTMDKADRKTRALLASKADLVGAIRLPNDAFKGNAGTEVTTDIIILRKKDGTPFNGENWSALQTVGQDTIEERQANGTTKDVEKDIMVNQYFADHPEMALGEHSLHGTMYGNGDYALKTRPGQDTQAMMNQAIQALPSNIFNQEAAPQASSSMDAGLANEGTKDGSYFYKDGAFYQAVDKRLTNAPWLEIRNFGKALSEEQKIKNETREKKLRTYDEPITQKEREKRIKVASDWIALRETAVRLIDMEATDGVDDSAIEAQRSKLNRLYDAYVKKWGTLTKSRRHNEAAAFLEDDPEYSLLQALEDEKREISVNGEESKTKWVKADIFRKRIRQPRSKPESVNNINDAINAALNFDGVITKKSVANLLGISEEEALNQIAQSGRAFLNPTTGLLETSEKYLSGNVRKKLAEAIEAAKEDPSLQGNVEALKKAVPKDRQLGEIYFELASRWIPSQVTSKFATSLLGTPAKVEYRQSMNKFSVVLDNQGTAENITTYGTKDLYGRDILVHALNGTEPTITRTTTDAFGNKKTEQDQEATQEARRKLRTIQQKFQSWAKTNTDTLEDGTSTQEAMEKAYNDTNNSVVPPSYSGDYLVKDPSNTKNPEHNVPGLSNVVWMNGHRRSVVARIIQEGSAMMAHGVGSGKTFSQIVAAMEMKRLGLSKKPMIVVQKATIGQFAKSVREAYPSARILVATEKTFESANRRRFMSRIATGDYDMVIVTQPQFDRILPGASIVRQYFNERLAELEQMKREQAATREQETGKRGRSGKTNDIETAIERLRAKMEKMLNSLKERGDNNLSFEQLGVDSLFIDEAHAYKKTSLVTNMRRVKGVPNDESQRAMGLEMKAEHIQRTNNGRNVILATGTPITNSMAEAYVMLKLATPHVLKEYNIGNFDDFARTFGKIVTDLEYTWGGKWKMVTRFKKFVNGNELISMIRSGFDVKMGNKELGLNVPKMRGENGKDEARLKVLPSIPAMDQVADWITSIANEYDSVMKSGSQEEKKRASAIPIVTMQAGMAAALDPRLVNPTLPDDPNSKVNTAVRDAKEIYDESADHKGAIVIFADRFKPMNTSLLQSFVNGRMGELNIDESEDQEETTEDEIEDSDNKDEKDSELSKQEDKEFKSGGFNLYYDIKSKLIAQGIPAGEIAIIHEYETDAKRASLFEAVNTGKIRVVIGSTEKLGVGVNMQERLVAALHLDPPRMMTPAMVEQRVGRIIRQGNGYAEPDKEGSPNWGGGVYNIYYGVEKSMDTGVYQMLENKGRAMAQALSGIGIGREFDDPSDELTQSMAMMKAIATGDKRVIDMAKFKQQMDELEGEKSAFDNAKSFTAKRLAETKQIVSRMEAQTIPLMGKDLEIFQANFQKGGEMPPLTINGETFEEFKDAAEALRNTQSRLASAALRSADNTANQKATIGGMPVTFEVRLTLDGKDIQDQKAIIYSPTNPIVELTTRRWESNEGVIQAIRNYAQGYQKVIDDTQAKMDNLKSQVSAMEAEMVAPWDRMNEFNQVSAELEGIKKSLVSEAKSNEPDVLQNAPPGGFTEADKVPAQQATPQPEETTKSKRQAVAAALQRLSQINESGPEYTAALEAVKQAREDLADWQIGRREEEEPAVTAQPGGLEFAIEDGESAGRAATARENIARINAQMKAGEMPLIAGRNAIKEELKKMAFPPSQGTNARKPRFSGQDQGAGLFSESEMPFNLTGEVDRVSLTPQEQKAKEQAAQEAQNNQDSQGALFARAPRFAAIDAETQRYIDDAFASLDEDAMLEQQDKAETQKKGQRTIGRPDLALGSLNTQIMGVDAYRERIATTETQDQWSNEAKQMLQSDYAGTRKRLIEAGMTGGTLSPSETKAAMMIVAKETGEAAKDPTKRAEVAKLIYAYRETGREEARALSARRDPFMSKQDRHREFLAKMIFSPSPADRKTIEKIANPKEKAAAIAAAADRRVSEIEKALAAMGVSFDDILKGEVEISLIKSRVVENTLKGFSAKEQEALRMIQKIGPEYAKIATAMGFSVSQVKGLHMAAIESIRRRHFEKVKKGLTVEDLKKDSSAVFARNPRALTDAEAEAEFAKIIDALGFGTKKKGAKATKKSFNLEDPIEVIKIARTIAATDKGALDMVQEYWMASLLSGITTHAANIAGNTANAALDLTFQRGMETLVNSVLGDKDSPQAGEFKYLMRGMKGSLSAAFRAGIRAYDAEQSMIDYDLLGHEVEIGQGGFLPGSNTGAAIKGLKGRIIRTSLRALQFMDDFSKTIVARMEVGAQAYRIAKANGLEGKGLSDFIDAEVNTIGSQSWERAVGRATTLAFQDKLRSLQEGGNLVEGGAYALNKGLQHYKPGKFFVPFIGTVYNIFRTGVRKSPIGSATMLYKLAREGFYSIQDGRLNPHPYAKSEFVRDAAEQIMAWALTAMLWSVAPGDDDDDDKGILITGSEPFQKGQTGLRDLNARMGLAAYHIRMGDTSFNYGRIEPIATVLGTTIDLIKGGKMVRDQREAGEILGYVASRILGQVVDKTYGRGMSDIAGFVQDPKSMSQWAVNFATTFVPNILRQPMRAMDPYVRETSIETSPKEFGKGLAQKFMQSALPMASVNQPRVDLYGKPIMKEGNTLSRLLLPAQVSEAPQSTQKGDRLLATWNKNHPDDAYAPGRPSRRYADPITGEIKYMDDKTFKKFSERAGQILATTSSAAITPSMIRKPSEDNKDMIRKMVTSARKQARAEVLATSPRKERSLKEILFGA